MTNAGEHDHATDYPAESGASRFFTGLRRGLRRKCPNCGHGLAFSGYLKIRETCECCDHKLGEYRCDDAPPYFTIFIVGHIVVPGALAVEQSGSPSLELQLGIWIPVTLFLTLALLPFIKGGVLGVQWAMGIRG
ncbi:DUF983 domain-containing protein [Thalassospira marina]|uniref:DUF983 domain-containing protein n=1 Tax=Thalassospira marina TaxID=2048283 RepID=A0A2N3KV62_9PROT|nr:DUF983 domain-containing protein [Thalassospira marina]PKR54469.1 hypothetical protein COO20_10105 [Thalassospira marina]